MILVKSCLGLAEIRFERSLSSPFGADLRARSGSIVCVCGPGGLAAGRFPVRARSQAAGRRRSEDETPIAIHRASGHGGQLMWLGFVNFAFS